VASSDGLPIIIGGLVTRRAIEFPSISELHRGRIIPITAVLGKARNWGNAGDGYCRSR
jgi:hypothetical protein